MGTKNHLKTRKLKVIIPRMKICHCLAGFTVCVCVCACVFAVSPQFCFLFLSFLLGLLVFIDQLTSDRTV